MGSTKLSYDEATADRAVELHVSGFSSAKIGKKLSISHQVARRILINAGIIISDRPTPEDKPKPKTLACMCCKKPFQAYPVCARTYQRLCGSCKGNA